MIIALQTLAGCHLGFILFAEDKDSGDCVIRALPQESALFGSKEYLFLADCQDSGEFTYKLEDSGNKLFIVNSQLELIFERMNSEERYSEINSGLDIYGILVSQ